MKIGLPYTVSSSGVGAMRTLFQSASSFLQAKYQGASDVRTALTHFDHGRNDGDDVVLADRDPGVGRERAGGG